MGRKARGDAFPERLVKLGLLSLTVAARMVHRRAYPQQYTIVEPFLGPEQLDALAHTIASLVPIYTVNYRSAGQRPLSAEELAGGVFRNGARELCYTDGRPSIHYLAARVVSTSLVARRLREVTGEAVA
jgi:hypothetical protein